MARSITISLPVADLAASRAFYRALGFPEHPHFADADGAFLVISETITVALITHAKWRTFTDRPIPPTTSSEVALNITCASRAEVDAMNAAAGQHGGVADINPIQDHPFMYGRDFADLDGHIWGAMWIDSSAMPTG